MRPVVHSMLCSGLALGLVCLVSAGDQLPIGKILKHPTNYQSKVVMVEGRARAVSMLPVHRCTRTCGGGAVYDSQMFVLQDKSGTIGISTTGTCRPNATRPVVQNEHLRIRGVVIVDRSDPKGQPSINAQAIDRVKP